MRVDIWSDVVCPWCYIGKRRFEAAATQLEDAEGIDGIHLDVTFRPFQLDPSAPPDTTTPVTEAYARKFGGEERAREIIERVTSVAATEGLDFHLERAQRANTFAAHRLMWWATQPGSGIDQAELDEQLMRAYFRDGLDVGDHDVLVDVASRIGADRADVAAFLASDRGADEVDAALSHAAAAGITAVPTFVVEDTWAIPGAQDTEVFVRALRKIAAKSRGAAGAARASGR